MWQAILFTLWQGPQLTEPAGPPPAPPSVATPGTPWACNRDTLLSGSLCALDGRTVARPASRESAQQNIREATALLKELCTTLSTRSGEVDGAVFGLCTSAGADLGACGDDGRRLLDDDGRFNHGHAGCYAALREAVAETQEFLASSADCCRCAARRCALPRTTCTQKLLAPQGLDRRCAASCTSACAALPTPGRKP